MDDLFMDLLSYTMQGNQRKINTAQSNFYDNGAKTGGAVFLTQTNFSDFESDFSRNIAALSGGAVYMKVFIDFVSENEAMHSVMCACC